MHIFLKCIQTDWCMHTDTRPLSNYVVPALKGKSCFAILHEGKSWYPLMVDCSVACGLEMPMDYFSIVTWPTTYVRRLRITFWMPNLQISDRPVHWSTWLHRHGRVKCFGLTMPLGNDDDWRLKSCTSWHLYNIIHEYSWFMMGFVHPFLTGSCPRHQ